MQAESNGDTEVSAVSWIVKEKKRMKQVEPQISWWVGTAIFWGKVY